MGARQYDDLMDHGEILINNLSAAKWIIVAACAAPLLALATRKRVPDVVWLLVLGVVIGPHVLDLAHRTEAIDFLRELGMGFLFLLAGMEINRKDLRGPQGKQGALTWALCAVLGFGAGLLLTQGNWQAAVVVAVACTSTALGTLLPILKDSGVLQAPLGRAALVHGAWGELLPIVAMSLLLSTRGTGASVLVLLAFAGLAVLVVFIPGRFFKKRDVIGRALVRASNTTMQTTLRFTVLALVSLMFLTAVLDLDVALGAFTAGLLLNVLFAGVAPETGQEVMHKIEIVGFSFLIPVFFVTSGMSIDVVAVLKEWPKLIGFVLVIAVVRGLVVFLREQFSNTHSGLVDVRERAALGLYAATGLPIIVAVTQIAESSELISPETGSLMVTGGALTVLAFPLLAAIITSRLDDREAEFDEPLEDVDRGDSGPGTQTDNGV